MSYTVVYSDYNGYPGSEDTYDGRSAVEIPILPDVNLYNSFNFELKATTVNARASTTQEEGAGDYSRSNNYRTTGYRQGTSTSQPHGAYMGTHVARIPTAMRWVRNRGPENNAIAQNELGDWFTEDVLSKADNKGGGVTFVDNIAQSGTFDFTFNTSAEGGGEERQQTHIFNVPYWNTLSIRGGYNAAVFCRNEFGYTDDYEGGTYEVKSLFELPEKFDRLYKFIPDQREFTTLEFQVEVDWQVAVSWGIYTNISSSNQQKILNRMGYTSSNQTGTDTHTITHVVNNSNNDWNRILNELVEERQRTPEEINKRYGQTFPQEAEDTEITKPEKIQ
jgi:hypothetical protein|tara:strand:+ start:748 stop:1749 length:1002 start_codon:yes stop_codon:yes gene_type:complete